MQKVWFKVAIIAFLVSACTPTDEQPQQQPPVYTGKIEAISGVEPRYEPYSATANNNYQANGTDYEIIQDPSRFSQQGFATWYNEAQTRAITATGEQFDPNALAAAHPVLPIPSYVRVTNLSNGRRLVVRINDRGPYDGRVIQLTKVAADRLNLTSKTKVSIDFIAVAADGTLSGPGTIGTEIIKQNFALPERPNIVAASDMLATPAISAQPAPVLPQVAPLNTSAQTQSSATSPTNSANPAGFMVQVGALSDVNRAAQWQKSLSKQLSVPGGVTENAGVYRVQLGPFSSKQQALVLQQRLQNEMQQTSFVTAAP